MLIVKIGGAAGIGYGPLAADLAALHAAGQRLVLLHGGSAGATALGERLDHPPRFVTSPSGHASRYTDRATLEIFIMATALLNRQLVELLRGLGANALGLSGIDGGLLRASRKDTVRIVEDGRVRILRDDWTGSVEAVNAGLLGALLEAGYLPVIAPLAISPRGEALNIDADRGAAQVAGALGAADLLLLSNVPGLLRDVADPASLIARVAPAQLAEAMDVARGRMRKKILAAGEALRAGVGRIILADGRRDQPIQAALRGEGTVIA